MRNILKPIDKNTNQTMVESARNMYQLREQLACRMDGEYEKMNIALSKYEVGLDDLLTPYLDTLDAYTPDSMKRMQVIFMLSTILAQRRVKIDIGKGYLVCNNISIILSGSGTNKSSSFKTLRNVIYDVLEDMKPVNTDPITMTRDDKSIASKYLSYFSGATEAGLMGQLEFADGKRGYAPVVNMDELADRLAGDPDTNTVIRVISELYTSGNLDSDLRKTKDAHREPIQSVSLNTMMMGSTSRIFEDSDMRKEFELIMKDKLLRRAFVYYDDESRSTTTHEFDSLPEPDRLECMKIAKISIMGVVNHSGMTQDMVCLLDDEAMELFNIYERFCRFRREGADPIYTVEMSGRDIKVLKVAPIPALLEKRMNMDKNITAKDIAWAIKYVESMDESVNNLIHAFSRGDNDTIRYNIMSRPDGLPLATIKDMGKFQSEEHVRKEFVGKFAGHVLYEENERIYFEDMSPNNKFILSGKPNSIGVKSERGKFSKHGYNSMRVSLDELHAVLSESYDLCMLELSNGVRNDDSAGDLMSILCMDIDYLNPDETVITREDVHELLSQYKHVISTSSDNTSDKMKVFIPLKHDVNVSEINYMDWVQEVAKSLKLPTIDKLPAVQVIWTYDNPILLSNLDNDEAVLLNPYNFVPASIKSDSYGKDALPDGVKYSPRAISNWSKEFFYRNKIILSKVHNLHEHDQTSIHKSLYSKIMSLIKMGLSLDEACTNMEWVIRVINARMPGRVRSVWVDETRKQLASQYGAIPSVGVDFTGLSIDVIEQQRKEYNERI